MKRRFNAGMAISAGAIIATATGIAIGRRHWSKSTEKAIRWIEAGDWLLGANVFAPDQIK